MPTKYTPAEVDEALICLAHCGENARRASALCGVPKATLQLWRSQTHRERYQELAERERPKLEQMAVDGAVAQILRADATTLKVYDRMDDLLDTEDASSKELSELAGAAQRLTTAKGINGTKLLELTGRPTQITEHRDGSTILRSLAQRLPGLIVEAEATEIPTTQTALVSETGRSNARSE